MTYITSLKTMLFGLLLSVFAAGAMAGDFDWVKDISLQAKADPDGVKLLIASQLDIAGADVDLVWSNSDDAGDAAAVLAIADASGRPAQEVLQHYSAQQGRGWGQLARSMGIKPGSNAFHRLKSGYYGPHDQARGDANPGNGKGKGK